ncbi:MAG: tetratricopeptide repeat protein [Phycisphaerales bacterium]
MHNTKTLAALTLLAVGLAACSSHGVHTSEGLAHARQRLDAMKAATEYEMAEQQFLAGDLPKAARTIERAIALSPTVTKVHVLKSRILMEQGFLEPARVSIKNALTINPDDPDAHYYAALIDERQSITESALDHYLTASKLDPANPLYTLAAADMLTDLARTDEANSLLEEARERFPSSAALRQAQAHLAMLQNDNERAATLLNDARLLAPDDRAILEDYARSLVACERWPEAEFHIARLLQTAPKEQPPRRDLQRTHARCLLQLNRPVDARAILLSLTSGSEGVSDVQSWIDLAIVSTRLNETARARSAANRVIGLAPTRPEGHLLLAASLRAEHRLQQALDATDVAIKHAPDNATAWVMRGVLLRDMSRTDDAEQAFATALRLNPNADHAETLLTGAVHVADPVAP